MIAGTVYQNNDSHPKETAIPGSKCFTVSDTVGCSQMKQSWGDCGVIDVVVCRRACLATIFNITDVAVRVGLIR